MSERIHLRIGRKDRQRLELISAVFGVSLTGAARVAIRAACEKLGLEKEATPDDFINNNTKSK